MEQTSSIYDKIFNSLERMDFFADGDYYLDDSTLLHCGKCHTPKRTKVNLMGKMRIMPSLCQCGAKQYRAEQEERELNQRSEALLRNGLAGGLTDKEYANWTFAFDDGRYPEISAACQKYVDEWEQMRADNVGLLFYGDIGIGKSFFACCIANALIAKGVPALVTNFPRLIQRIQTITFDPEGAAFFDCLQRYDLVVIDDLGVERNTGYGLEQVYAIVDTRYRSGKPLIVTTNLTPGANNVDIANRRIYDRIKQNSIPVQMRGQSRRGEIAARKREKYQKFFGLRKDGT